MLACFLLKLLLYAREGCFRLSPLSLELILPCPQFSLVCIQFFFFLEDLESSGVSAFTPEAKALPLLTERVFLIAGTS